MGINYRDILRQVSFVGEENSVFVSSSYMGSLSTLDELPKEWWVSFNKEGTNRHKGDHCAVWLMHSVLDARCTGFFSLVCETPASQNLKQYIKNLDDLWQLNSYTIIQVHHNLVTFSHFKPSL